jgi:hypothetical protein
MSTFYKLPGVFDEWALPMTLFRDTCCTRREAEKVYVGFIYLTTRRTWFLPHDFLPVAIDRVCLACKNSLVVPGITAQSNAAHREILHAIILPAQRGWLTTMPASKSRRNTITQQ